MLVIMRELAVKKSCPFCKEFQVVRKGKYFCSSKPHWIQRYLCNACCKTFNSRKLSHITRVPRWNSKTETKVKKLINTKTFVKSKYDHRKTTNLKDFAYPSSREIVKIIAKGKGPKISKSTVSKLIKKYRVLD